MATVRVSFEMPDTVRDELVEAICSIRGYQSTINGEANPQSPAQYAMQDFVSYGQALIAQRRHELARQVAAVATEAALDEEVRAERLVTFSAEEI